MKKSNDDDLKQIIESDKQKYQEMCLEYEKVSEEFYISAYNKSVIPRLLEEKNCSIVYTK